MKYLCKGCGKAWFTLDPETPGREPEYRSCPRCMREAGYRWVDVPKMEYTNIEVC